MRSLCDRAQTLRESSRLRKPSLIPHLPTMADYDREGSAESEVFNPAPEIDDDDDTSSRPALHRQVVEEDEDDEDDNAGLTGNPDEDEEGEGVDLDNDDDDEDEEDEDEDDVVVRLTSLD